MRIADKASALGEDAAPAVCLTCTNHHRSREKPKGYFELRPRWRFETLSSVGAETTPKQALDVTGLFGWMAKAAYPRGKRVQQAATSLYGEERNHGTLHQVVAEPETGRLHVKLGAVGKHIRDVAGHPYDVKALVTKATPTTK